MDRDELAFAGVARQAELIAGGEVSSRELVELYLERIERLDPELNAFRKVMAERALVDAQQADARRGAGDERPLLGVPIAVKDVEDVTGEVTTLRHRRVTAPAARTASWCRRLRAAGRGRDRQDEPARAGDHGRHRGPRLRHHAQPLEHRPQRRAARAAAARPRWRRACARARPPPTAPARSASRRRTAAWSGSSPPATASRYAAGGALVRDERAPASRPAASRTRHC